MLRDPVRVTVGQRNAPASSVQQRLVFVGQESGKLMALRDALREGLRPPVLVFVNSRQRASVLHRCTPLTMQCPASSSKCCGAYTAAVGHGLDRNGSTSTGTPHCMLSPDNSQQAYSACTWRSQEVKLHVRAASRDLALEGVRVASISAEQTPAARTAVVDSFREGRVHVLVCTDLMARGIDFLNVQTVVNYDFPQSAIDYIHRYIPCNSHALAAHLRTRVHGRRRSLTQCPSCL